MRFIIFIWFLALSANSFAQTSPTDTNWTTAITSVNWVPEGKSLLLKIVKFNKPKKFPPVFKSYSFDIATRQLTPLFEGGNSLAASPDGKTIVFCRQNEKNKGDLYLYDMATQRQTAL